MKIALFRITPALAALAIAGQGCAVVPFLPLIAAAPKALLPPPQAASQAVPKPDPPDPQIAQQLHNGKPGEGDAGVEIPSQDRVAFAPDTSGSIPLRVAAVDLVSDVKARAVGDIVTVHVVESVTGETQAGTSLANKRSTNAALPNLFSGIESIATKNPLLNLGSLVNSSSDNSTTGTGDMTAADTFATTVSAVVVAVNPSGTLTIKGERSLKLNGEDDTIHLAGVVRPEDVDSTNTVQSTSVADLQLSITGEGQIRDKQGNGFGTRLLDWLWLF
jgi:flagellar L-ring protein precursor FlgH